MSTKQMPKLHTIQRKETLYAIARQYEGVSVDDLVAANPHLLTNGRGTALEIGWQLKIPGSMPSTLHTIQRKETLYAIARQYEGVSVDDLVAANPHLLTNGRGTALEIGWQLTIPGQYVAFTVEQPFGKLRNLPRPSTPPFDTSTGSAHRKLRNQPPTALEKKVMDRVRRFDPYIKEASQKFGISVEKIRAIIATESLGKADANNGRAFGLMQITPVTWEDARRREPELRGYDFREAHWKDPRINILFGTAVFRRKMKALGVDPSDESSAEIAVIAYNAGEGTVRRAINNAQASRSPSPNPSADSLRAEHLKPAIKSARIYEYYLTGRGNKYNPYINGSNPYHEEAAIDAAVDLKYKEISNYPTKVRKYLAVQAAM